MDDPPPFFNLRMHKGVCFSQATFPIKVSQIRDKGGGWGS